ncbi:MAG: glycoside hydrolase family 95-like protein, partial [Bryobacteraceae bacterium]
EFRDVLLGKKTRSDLSVEARRLGGYDASLATLVRDDSAVEKGHLTPISHILSSGSELALQFWWRWEYTRDRQWLAESAYPLMKECAEFYMSFAKLGPDQRMHVYPSNVHESFLGVRDSISDLAAIRGLFPVLIQASEILAVDALQRAKWKAFLQKLAPYPMGDNPLAQQLGASLGPGRWAAGLFAGIAGKRNTEEVWTMPVFPFEDVTDDSHNEENWKIANYTYRSLPQRATLLGGGGPELLDEGKVPVHSRLPILAARLGRPDEVRRILPAFAALVQRSPNGMPSGDPGMSMVEGLGIPAFALQEALLQSTGGLIQLFPAWPDEWDAQFRLRTRGAFIVSASKRKNVTELVEIESLAGETCHIWNPWSGQVFLYADGKLRSKLKGDVLEFPTTRGEILLLLPRSTRSPRIRMDVFPPPSGIQELKVVFPSEQVLHTQLGK